MPFPQLNSKTVSVSENPMVYWKLLRFPDWQDSLGYMPTESHNSSGSFKCEANDVSTDLLSGICIKYTFRVQKAKLCGMAKSMNGHLPLSPQVDFFNLVILMNKWFNRHISIVSSYPPPLYFQGCHPTFKPDTYHTYGEFLYLGCHHLSHHRSNCLSISADQWSIMYLAWSTWSMSLLSIVSAANYNVFYTQPRCLLCWMYWLFCMKWCSRHWVNTRLDNQPTSQADWPLLPVFGSHHTNSTITTTNLPGCHPIRMWEP